MTIFIWNLYEKSFTPYHAQLAPKKYVHRHKIERQPSRVSKYFQDSKVKSARSLQWAMAKEKEYIEERKRTHPDEFEEDEEEEEEVAAVEDDDE